MSQIASFKPQSAIVFLDIDDVLCLNAPYGGHAAILALTGRHSNPSDVYERLFHRRTRGVLKDVHERLMGRVQYVISSTWREYLDRKCMFDVFNATNMDFVANAMYDGRAWSTPVSRGRGSRADEIGEWLRNHHEGEPFVILDDTLSGSSLGFALENPLHPFAGRVLLCEEWEGLLERHVPFIVSALERPAKREGAAL